MEWTSQKVLELLDLYQKYPLLWNSALKKQKDEEERFKMYENIAIELDCSPDVVKSKIDSLRSQYVKEVDKEKHYRACGSLYKSRWFAFEAIAKTSVNSIEDEKENYKNTKTDVKNEPHKLSADDEPLMPFCLHVSNELKNIKDPEVLALVKFKVNRILFKAATGSYKNTILSEQKKNNLQEDEDSE